MSVRDEKRLKNLEQLFEVYSDRLRTLNERYVLATDSSERNQLSYEVEIAKTNIDLIEQQMATLLTADEAVDIVESLASNVAGNLQSLMLAGAEKNIGDIKALEEQINSLVKTSTESVQQLKERSLSSIIEPRLSVLRPNVKLVDANLAYRYADLQSDVNILFGFTTLFLGTGIASAISFGIAFSTATEKPVVAIHLTITIFSMFVTLLFGFLSLRAYKKANKAKEKFETDTGEREVLLHPVEEKNS